LLVGIDARVSFYDSAGIGVYINNISRAVQELTSPSEVMVFRDFRESIESANDSRSVGLLGPAHSNIGDHLFAMQAALFRPSIVHFTDHICLKVMGARSVVTVHDLSFLRVPHTHSTASIRYYSRCIDSLKLADAIICVSEFTRSELLELTDVRPEDVFVVPHGAKGFLMGTDADLDCGEGSTLVEEPYALCVGTYNERKNVVQLANSFVDNFSNDKMVLAFAGAEGNAAAELRSISARNPSKIRVLGRVMNSQLQRLIVEAEMLVAPSLYEGFGLPVLDAMAYGVPVVVSNRQPFMDLAGNAAWVFDPANSAGMSGAMMSVRKSCTLREKKINTGLELAAEFSWEQTAKKTMAAYDYALR